MKKFKRQFLTSLVLLSFYGCGGGGGGSGAGTSSDPASPEAPTGGAAVIANMPSASLPLPKSFSADAAAAAVATEVSIFDKMKSMIFNSSSSVVVDPSAMPTFKGSAHKTVMDLLVNDSCALMIDRLKAATKGKTIEFDEDIYLGSIEEEDGSISDLGVVNVKKISDNENEIFWTKFEKDGSSGDAVKTYIHFVISTGTDGAVVITVTCQKDGADEFNYYVFDDREKKITSYTGDSSSDPGVYFEAKVGSGASAGLNIYFNGTNLLSSDSFFARADDSSCGIVQLTKSESFGITTENLDAEYYDSTGDLLMRKTGGAYPDLGQYAMIYGDDDVSVNILSAGVTSAPDTVKIVQNHSTKTSTLEIASTTVGINYSVLYPYFMAGSEWAQGDSFYILSSIEIKSPDESVLTYKADVIPAAKSFCGSSLKYFFVNIFPFKSLSVSTPSSFAFYSDSENNKWWLENILKSNYDSSFASMLDGDIDLSSLLVTVIGWDYANNTSSLCDALRSMSMTMPNFTFSKSSSVNLIDGKVEALVAEKKSFSIIDFKNTIPDLPQVSSFPNHSL